MENYTAGNVCRTCLKLVDNLKKIDDVNITVENYTKSALEILNLLTEIEVNTNWPDFICVVCIDKLSEIYSFKLQCDKSNSLLKEYFDSKSRIVDECLNLDNCYTEDSQFNTQELAEEIDVKSSNKRRRRKPMLSGINVSSTLLRSRVKTEEFSELENTHSNFDCKTCKKSFDSEDSLCVHAKCHEIKPFCCTLCNKRFKTKGFLRKHTEKIHKEIKQEPENNVDQFDSHICKICSKPFKSKYILTVHKKRHALKGHFLCPTCGKGFNSKGCLNRHTRVHTGEKKFQCTVCKKRFPSSNNLNMHSRIHSGVKPYLCTICGKSFSHPTGLTYHTRTHTKEKNYLCDICNKSFAIQCHLDNHRRIHTGERPFPCNMCNKAFIKKVDLQRHKAIHAGVKPHVCPVCAKEFLRLLHLNYHMMLHTEERPHKCSHCNKGFIRRYYLKDHMMKHHGVDLPPLKGYS